MLKSTTSTSSRLTKITKHSKITLKKRDTNFKNCVLHDNVSVKTRVIFTPENFPVFSLDGASF